MGVHGLWRLIEPSGKKVPLETLENRVLAVDVSIWLHQAIKGFQDSRGAPVPNAHLLGVYHRVCKLLYYKIRPVFVFDGGVPILKKQTIAKRNHQKNKLQDVSSRLHQQILSTLLKQSVVSTAIHEKEKLSPTKNKSSPVKPSRVSEDDELFKLPKLPSSQDILVKNETESDNESESSDSDDVRPRIDMDSVDEKSQHFRSLPADIRHDILTELIENSKVSSWHKIRQMPSDSGDFSKFQIKRLLKKHSIQISLEEAEKEMGGHTLSLGDLEALLTEEGIVTASKSSATSSIASDENTKYLLIKDIHKAMIKAKQDQEAKEKINVCKTENINTEIIQTELEEQGSSSKTENIFETMHRMSKYEYDLQNAIKLSLSQCVESSESNNTKEGNSVKNETFSYIENFNDLDFASDTSSDDGIVSPIKKSHLAKSYMIEYSGLTPAEIDNILGTNLSKSNTQKYFMNEMLLNTPKSERKKEDTDQSKNVNLDVRQNDNLKSVHENITPKLIKKSLFNVPSSPPIKSSENSSNLIVDDVKNENVHNLLESEDSNESDDFVEVSDSETKNTSTNKNSLEIIIEPHLKIEDDLFSDIFNEPSKVENNLSVQDLHTSLSTKKSTVDCIEDNSLSIKHSLFKESIIKEETQNNPIIYDNPLDDCNELQQNNTFLKASTSADLNSNERSINIEHSLTNNQNEKAQQPVLTAEELKSMQKSLEKEHQELINEKAHQDRMANSISDQMYKEAQELLELFGLPYIVAPMEAEAQCAFLESIKLTDGTITDDSDIWLFGGQKVYKNFFSHKKEVLEFQNENIKHYFKLTRQQLILLALLVGSDYTLGIQGIGPVTALEILAAFPPSNSNYDAISQDELITGLKDFKNWWNNGKPVGLRKTHLKSKLKNVSLSEGFPSCQVINAYMHPEVETSKEKFSWGKPDMNKLIHYARLKFGWSEKKSTEILLPVIKRMEDAQVQKSIKAYFAARPTVMSDKKMSKRVQLAVQKIDKQIINESEDDEDLNDVLPPVKKVAKNVHKNKKEEIDENNQFKQFTKKCGSKMRKTKVINTDESNIVTVDIEVKPFQKIERKIQTICTPKKYVEIIPQREKDKLNALKTKLKAIETYRKSKRGPGYVQKRKKIARTIKDNAELSENSSDE